MKRGRYATPADLVRPYAEGGPRRAPVALLLWFAAVLVIGTLILLPVLDRQAMRTPLRDAIAGLRMHRLDAVRGAFTADAVVGDGTNAYPAGEVITAAEPLIREYAVGGNLRLTGLQQQRRLRGGDIAAECTVAYDLSGDDLPYRRIPVQHTGQVVLHRTGWFRWKIVALTLRDADVGEVFSRLAPP